MSNEMFLIQYQNLYESLRYFKIKGNLLILQIDDSNKQDNKITFTMPLTNVVLSNINPSLFLLKPDEIYHTLYILELLPKSELNSYETEFITNFVNKYLTHNDKALAINNSENHNPELSELNTALNGFKIPIYLSYDPEFENTPASMLIKNLINAHSTEIENNKGNHPRLVLVNPNVESQNNDDEFLLSQAGFATLILIALTVASTCLFLAYFMTNR